MGDKYIIEKHEKDSIWRMYADAYGDVTVEGVDLTPYTEPDTTRIENEAYQRGVEDGAKSVENWNEQEKKLRMDEAYQKGYQDATEKISSDEQAIADKAYQSGLNDAWKAARKLWDYDPDTLKEIFGWVAGERDVFIKYTAAEAIEKLRQREQEKEEIKVGDEAISPDGKAVVTEISDRNVRIMYSNGSGYVTQLEELTKTGRHFSEIAAVLAKMKEES